MYIATILVLLVTVGYGTANILPVLPCLCTLQYDPVCASNGQTYSNTCFMNCAGPHLTTVHPGACRPPPSTNQASEKLCMCTLQYSPVCASNGLTYSNTCFMNCAGSHLTVVHSGSCRKVEATSEVTQCARPCPDYIIEGMFCTMDESTGRVTDHLNGCQRDIAICEAAEQNKILSKVECPGQSTTSSKCARPCPFYAIQGMFCTIDGSGQIKDHLNGCQMEVAMCEAAEQNLVLKKVECPTVEKKVKQECPTICPLYFIEGKFCGRDHLGNIQDYGNPCVLNSNKCQADKLGLEFSVVDCP